MAGNCLFDPFLLNYIHIYRYFFKKRDSYQIFRLSMKISWTPGSQVPRHYPTLVKTMRILILSRQSRSVIHCLWNECSTCWGKFLDEKWSLWDSTDTQHSWHFIQTTIRLVPGIRKKVRVKANLIFFKTNQLEQNIFPLHWLAP